MKKRVIMVVFVVLLIGVGLFVYLGQRRNQGRPLYYSGTIESTDAELSFQVGGRVVAVLVDEGQAVQEGEMLAELDRSEYEARLAQAQANLRKAEENVRQLEAVLEMYEQALPAEVVRAEAGVGALRSQLEELEAGSRSQEIERARLALQAAEDVVEKASRNKTRYDALFQSDTISEKEKDAVDLHYETSLKEQERAKETFDLLKEGSRKETIQTAKAKLDEGVAVLSQARSNLKKIDATRKQVDGARAELDSAKASVELAEIQLGHSQLRAPYSGIITNRQVEPGEVVVPGREVLTLSDLTTVDLKIFVDETEIGKVKPGQHADIKVDTFPAKVYRGEVSYISPEAEFTPKFIQTHKERVKLVYLVKISIPNPDLELKSGMPADAWLR
jgi:HlyD family secretion protein